MYYLNLFLFWYLLGLISWLFIIAWYNFAVRVPIIVKLSDVQMAIISSVAGPIIFVLFVFKGLVYLYDKVDNMGNKVIWQNRRAKNKNILFGTRDEE